MIKKIKGVVIILIGAIVLNASWWFWVWLSSVVPDKYDISCFLSGAITAFAGASIIAAGIFVAVLEE